MNNHLRMWSFPCVFSLWSTDASRMLWAWLIFPSCLWTFPNSNCVSSFLPTPEICLCSSIPPNSLSLSALGMSPRSWTMVLRTWRAEIRVLLCMWVHTTVGNCYINLSLQASVPHKKIAYSVMIFIQNISCTYNANQLNMNIIKKYAVFEWKHNLL